MNNFGTVLRKYICKNFQPIGPLIKRHYAGNESFLTGASGNYIEDMYNAWLKDPNSVHTSWASYFKNMKYHSPPTLARPARNEVPLYTLTASSASPAATAPQPTSVMPQKIPGDFDKIIRDHLAIQGVIRSYQVRGHLLAALDPLEIMGNEKGLKDRLGHVPKKIARQHDVAQIDPNAVFKLPSSTRIGGNEDSLPFKEIIKRLENAYCRHIGTEYMFINNMVECDWIRERLEPPGATNLTKDEKILLLQRLGRATLFEAFLAKKYTSEKRFGLEGCDVMIPSMKTIIDVASQLGAEMVVIGMAHRGRLNVLANICRKPLYSIFSQFFGLESEDIGSGDVKYHLGTYVERLNRQTNKNIKVVIVANPSHLESINGVVLGRVRAEQFFKGDLEGKRTLTLLVHGDASFSGQGIVYETLNMSYLPEYTTRGVIHLVVNNQIGFTTDPRFSRSAPYCTNAARVVTAPIFHVNSDDPESVIHVSKMATEFRYKFKKDVVLDIVCYRRNGHNEADEPSFTQPLMYKKIRSMKNIFQKYSEHLIKNGIITADEVKQIENTYNQIMEDDMDKAKKETKIRLRDWIDSPWSGFFEGKEPLKNVTTGVKEETLQHIGKIFSSPPPSGLKFVIHKGIERVLKGRMDMMNKRVADWALGEAFAFGSLVKEGITVRLSGQDVERGTFSHRHHVLHHQEIDKVTYCPLKNLYPDQANYTVCNSPLSEFGVFGFEVGFSMTNPNCLCMWESQFGDFANPGQVIFDQIVSSGETKWIRQCGMVVSMPHGQEGQGPEHSSARIERILQLADEDPDTFPPETPDFAMRQLQNINWIAITPTTPANMFHLLRRQIALPFRKPVIVFTPKSLLRHPLCKSSLDDFIEGTEFTRMIPDAGPASKNPNNVKKLVFCMGKVYYEALMEVEKRNLQEQIAIARVEQMCPFPFDLVKAECNKYPNAQLTWLQEEYKNQGAYYYCSHRIKTATENLRPVAYAGRPTAATTAAGYKPLYVKEYEHMIADLVSL